MNIITSIIERLLMGTPQGIDLESELAQPLTLQKLSSIKKQKGVVLAQSRLLAAPDDALQLPFPWIRILLPGQQPISSHAQKETARFPGVCRSIRQKSGLRVHHKSKPIHPLTVSSSVQQNRLMNDFLRLCSLHFTGLGKSHVFVFNQFVDFPRTLPEP